MKQWKRSLAMGAMALVLSLVVVPARAFATEGEVGSSEVASGAREVASSYELTAALSEGVAAVVLTADINDAGSYTISHGVTIDGQGYAVRSNVTDRDVFVVETSEPVVIRDIEIESAWRAITLYGTTSQLTVDGAMITAAQRGITVYDGLDAESYLTVENSTIQQEKATLAAHSANAGDDYDTAVSSDGSSGMYRGISLWELNATNVTVRNTTIQGFWVSINISGSDRDAYGSSLTVEGSTLKARAGINNWAENININVTGSKLLGINNFAGTYEAFANIVLEYSTSGVNLNVTDTEFTNYQNAAGLASETSLQFMISNRAEGEVNRVNLAGETSFVDATGKLWMNLEPDCESEDAEGNTIYVACGVITATGGVYDYADVEDYVDATKYNVYEMANGRYIVVEKAAVEEALEAVAGGEIAKVLGGEASTKLSLDDPDGLKEELAAGAMIYAELGVAELAAEDWEELAGYDEMLGELKEGEEIATLYDGTVRIRSRRGDEAAKTLGQVHELDDEMELVLEIPEAYRTVPAGYARKWYVMHIHQAADGTVNVERIEPTVGETDLTFSTSKFSTFAISYVDTYVAVAPEVAEETEPEVAAPETGFFTGTEMSTSARIGQLSTALIWGVTIVVVAMILRRIQLSHWQSQRKAHTLDKKA